MAVKNTPNMVHALALTDSMHSAAIDQESDVHKAVLGLPDRALQYTTHAHHNLLGTVNIHAYSCDNSTKHTGSIGVAIPGEQLRSCHHTHDTVQLPS